jgi:hypothetical protein
MVFPEQTLNRMDPIEVPINGSLKDFPVPALHADLYHQVLLKITKYYVSIYFLPFSHTKWGQHVFHHVVIKIWHYLYDRPPA